MRRVRMILLTAVMTLSAYVHFRREPWAFLLGIGAFSGPDQS